MKNPWFSVSIVLFCFVVAQAYISYKFPIKQDLFGHRFSSHLGNRLTAYALLLKSGKKFRHYDPEQINRMIEQAAMKYDVDPFLIQAITMYESYYLPHAISTTGAMGLMALMPRTAWKLGVRDPFDPIENIDGGTRQLKILSESFQGDVSLILASYNAGETNVEKYNGMPPYRETIAYVHNVRKIYDILRGMRNNAKCKSGVWRMKHEPSRGDGCQETRRLLLGRPEEKPPPVIKG